ncbi:pentapeptide repeat-containing protein [Sphingopyxis sp. Root1497]|uniref:pentapeptide repeat-containing protein n=1 Tax=Sphingopyxis sp. Root1497 TaxID=1736474 RepID=UPI0009EB36F7|nr:pentapeptide repeat-containing protein [Sphingopyxis sp. Root1497]
MIIDFLRRLASSNEHCKPLANVSVLPAETNHILGVPIVRAPVSKDPYEKLDLRHRRFDDINAHNARFVDCDFSYSIFERAYFRSAVFSNCKFVGCRFYDCNLRGASFPASDFKYATFHRSLIEPKEMLALLPHEPNLRRDTLQNLRANAAEIGDFSSQRDFVLAEIAAAVDHQARAWEGSGDYYRRKYPGFLDKARAGLVYVGLYIGGLLWGHGERPLRMIGSAAFLVLGLSLINLWAVVPKVGWEESRAGLEILRYCFDLFWDYNPDKNFRGFLIVDYALIGMRYLYIGLFISVVYKSISHR